MARRKRQVLSDKGCPSGQLHGAQAGSKFRVGPFTFLKEPGKV